MLQDKFRKHRDLTKTTNVKFHSQQDRVHLEKEMLWQESWVLHLWSSHMIEVRGFECSMLKVLLINTSILWSQTTTNHHIETRSIVRSAVNVEKFD
jgi:hypothetical protein